MPKPELLTSLALNREGEPGWEQNSSHVLARPGVKRSTLLSHDSVMTSQPCDHPRPYVSSSVHLGDESDKLQTLWLQNIVKFTLIISSTGLACFLAGYPKLHLSSRG